MDIKENGLSVEVYRAIAVAINSLAYDPNLSDIEIQSYEIALASLRDYVIRKESEINE